MDKEPTLTVVQGDDAVDIFNLKMDTWHYIRDGSALQVMVRSTDKVGVLRIRVDPQFFDDLFGL